MKKSVKKKKAVASSSSTNMDIVNLIEALCKKLVSLECKIDTLISRQSSAPVQHSNVSHRSQPRQDNGYNRERVLHKVICADCNKECEVPFRPSGDRPVYCKECFAKRKNGSVVQAQTQSRSFESEHGIPQSKPEVKKKKALSRKK